MPTDIKNAVGIQRQFRPMPDKVYQKNLINPRYNAYQVGKDYSAERFAQSLGVLGKATWNEAVAKEKREQNQFTLEAAQRAVAGMTPDDLKHFDYMNWLQHNSGTGYDLSDNKYAIALLNKAMGQQAANNAMEQYLTDNDGKVPKSSEDAVGAYQQAVQDQLDNMDKDRIVNMQAFQAGLQESNFQNSFKISDTARKAIKEDMQATGQRTMYTEAQKIISNSESMGKHGLKQALEPIIRQAQLYVDTPQQAAQFWAKFLNENKDYITSNDVLDALDNVAFFDADGKRHTFGSEIPTGGIRKQIALNDVNNEADKIFEACKKPDGTIDMAKAEAMLKNNRSMRIGNSTGSEYIPLKSISPELDELIIKECQAQGLPIWFGTVISRIENRNNPDVINAVPIKGDSSAGAIGPMQLLPSTAAQYGCTNPRDMAQNVHAGIAYLVDMKKRHPDWDDRTLAMHYCAGEGDDYMHTKDVIEYGQLFDKEVAGLQKNPNYGKTLLPHVDPSTVQWENANRDIKYEFDHNMVPGWNEALPQILGILEANGIPHGNIVMTSAHRDGNGTSWHDHGDAVDIYIGDLSKTEGQKYADLFQQYFKEAIYEVKGYNPGYGYSSGFHIHLGHLLDKDALMATDNSYDYSNEAYDNQKAEKILARLKVMNNDAKQAVREAQSEAYDKMSEYLYDIHMSNDEKLAKIKAIPNLEPKYIKQAEYHVAQAQAKEDKLAAKAAAGLMTPSQKYYYKYTNSQEAINDRSSINKLLEIPEDDRTDAQKNTLEKLQMKKNIAWIVLMDDRQEAARLAARLGIDPDTGEYVGTNVTRGDTYAAQQTAMIMSQSGMTDAEINDYLTAIGKSTTAYDSDDFNTIYVP